jgi:catechol 2,3-dioxygenase-like lactoylglutathione lyase family enzyme
VPSSAAPHQLRPDTALQSLFMFEGIEHLAISSPNPEKLAQWYVDNLGFHINYTYAGNYFVRAANGVMMEIIPATNSLAAPQVMANNKDAGFRHLAIMVEDFDAGVADLKAKGVQMVGEPYETQGNRLAFFNDADGNLVHLIKRENPLP